MRLNWSGFGRSICLAATAAACLAGGDAFAQGKLDAKYVATLAGVPIGKGAWVVDIADDHFTAAASGMTTGLLRVFATGEGTGASHGRVRGADILQPTVYASTVNTEKRTEEVRIGLANGTIKEFTVDPPTIPNPARVPLTDAHRRGVVDPMSATLIRVPGTADPVSPEACHRTLPMFDGRMRFDLQLSFKRIEHVHADKGYQGPVAVCGVQFVPLAGHIPDRAAIKYLMAERDMEMWLAPIAGTRIVVPFRMSLQTPLGQGVLEATQFVTTAGPPRLAPATAAR
jgi:hypothetical protein